MTKTAHQQLTLCILIPLILCAYTAATGYTNTQSPMILVYITVLSLTIHWIAAVPAISLKTEKFYDIIGTVAVWGIIICCYLLSPMNSPRSLLLAGICLLWTTRLGLFLLYRIHNHKKDSRFDSIKRQPLSFMIAWEMSATWTVVTTLCATAAMTSMTQAPLSSVDIGLLCGWLVAWLTEAVADWQKYQFKQHKQKTPFICTGLWAYCRYPNYLSEMLMWILVACLSWPNLTGTLYMSLISPCFVIILLTSISGINLQEAANEKRFGRLKSYQKYKKDTPLLIPKIFS